MTCDHCGDTGTLLIEATLTLDGYDDTSPYTDPCHCAAGQVLAEAVRVVDPRPPGWLILWDLLVGWPLRAVARRLTT